MQITLHLATNMQTSVAETVLLS